MLIFFGNLSFVLVADYGLVADLFKVSLSSVSFLFFITCVKPLRIS